MNAEAHCSHMMDLNSMRVAILVSDGFEESELVEPMRALREACAIVEVVSPKSGALQGLKHLEIGVQIMDSRVIDNVRPTDYDAVMLPGGVFNADHLRVHPQAQRFIREMDTQGKPIAAICHAPWLLISSGIVRGRTLTSYHTLKDDVQNAGGNWVDQEVAVDRNWVTSRTPADLGAFNREMLKLFSSRSPSIVQIAESA